MCLIYLRNGAYAGSQILIKPQGVAVTYAMDDVAGPIYTVVVLLVPHNFIELKKAFCPFLENL